MVGSTLADTENPFACQGKPPFLVPAAVATHLFTIIDITSRIFLTSSVQSIELEKA
jgi:hypothetical protein